MRFFALSFAPFAGYSKYREAMEFYILAGDYTNAQAMQNNLPATSDEDKLYAWEAQAAIDLKNNGHTWLDVDSTTADTIGRMVQYNKDAGYMAGSILALTGKGFVTWPIPDVPAALIDSAINDTTTIGARAAQDEGGQPKIKINNLTKLPFSVYPNPTYGVVTIKTSEAGKFVLYSMLGQQLAEYFLTSGEMEIQLPVSIASGIYIGKFKPMDGGPSKEVKILYQP